ncbi:MAG: hypothetical protein IK045_01840 [Bacteroidales bacterium]|nr:hypothetical protein [Bacteroidales bacterium]
MKRFSIILLAGAALLAGCTKELVESPVVGEDGYVITASATAPGAFIDSKVNYTDAWDEREGMGDITAGAWSAGDSFTALEINGDVITPVTFTTTGTGASAEFKSSGAVAADENTTWVAVSGKATVENGTLICSYDGQDGSLGKLGNYDYAVAQATGASPVFDFASGKRLTYVLRLKVPAQTKYVEFNTGKDRNGGWNINSAAKAMGTTSCTEKEAVKMITLSSDAGGFVYLAVPAIDLMHSSENRLAGIIVTIMTADKRHSQGKAISTNLAARGGHTALYDMSSLEWMARPLASEAIKLGSITYGSDSYPLGSWAPFNVGGDVPTSDEAIKGGQYSWAETESKTSFTKNNYRWLDGSSYSTQRGYKYVGVVEGVKPFIEVSYAGGKGHQHGPGTYYDIAGTKYDAARVKWGSEWKMPSSEICNNLLKNGDYSLTEEIDVDEKLKYTEYEAGTYTNDNGYKSTTMGCIVYEANGAKLALYRCSYTDNGSTNSSGTEGRYWMSCTDYGTRFYTDNPESESGNYWNRACQMRLIDGENYINNKSWVWDGLRIRAVLNE